MVADHSIFEPTFLERHADSSLIAINFSLLCAYPPTVGHSGSRDLKNFTMYLQKRDFRFYFAETFSKNK